MGRRALRKLNPEIDLSRHLLAEAALPNPWNPQSIFDRTAPLEVEVGSGKGLFLSAAARAEPDRDFLGIEVAAKYAAHTASKLARRELANARIVHGDARRIFATLLPEASLDAVHVYFPDPWWKARHLKRRIMSADFLRDVQRTLRDGAWLHFWTDVEEYFQKTMEVLKDFPMLAGPIAVEERAPEHELDYQTHFERRKRMSGLPIFRSKFQRVPRS